MLVDGILERNREFVRQHEPRPLAPAETLQLVVVACYDPRLDPLLLPALGLHEGEAFLLRTAGALVLPGGGVMRSLAMAVFMFGATEIVVVGHSSCRMARFRNNEFIDLFRARGVRRDSFGVQDLREWAGAIASPRAGVQRSIGTIVNAPFLPPDVTVAGMVLDDTTGELDLVTRDARATSSLASQPFAPTAGEDERGEDDEPADEPEREQEQEGAGGSDSGAAPDDLSSLVDALAGVVRKVEAQKKWRYESETLRQQLAQTRNPLAQFRLLETFLRRVAGDSRDVARSIERLRDELSRPEHGRFAESLARLLGPLSGRQP